MAERQVTAAPVGIDTGVSQRTSKFLNELTQVSGAFQQGLQSLQQISQQNTQRELNRIATEKRVQAEAKQEAIARKRAKEAAERKAEAARKEQERIEKARQKERQKLLEEKRKAQAEQAKVTLLRNQTLGRGVENTGQQAADSFKDNPELSRGLIDTAISAAKDKTERQLKAQIDTLTDEQKAGFDYKQNYVNMYTNNLANDFGVTPEMLDMASPKSLEAVLTSQEKSASDFFDVLVDERIQMRNDALDQSMGVQSRIAIEGAIAGKPEALEEMINTISNPANTLGEQLTQEEVAGRVSTALGALVEELKSDDSITQADALKIYDAQVSNADQSVESVMNHKKLIESKVQLRNELKKSKNESTAKLNMAVEAQVTTTTSSQNTTEFTANAQGLMVLPPQNGFMYTPSEYQAAVTSGQITAAQAKKLQNKQISLNLSETRNANATAELSQQLKAGKPVELTKYDTKVQTEAYNRVVFGEGDPVVNMQSLYSSANASPSWTAAMKSTFRVDTSTPQNLQNSFMMLDRLEKTGGKLILDYKMPKNEFQKYTITKSIIQEKLGLPSGESFDGVSEEQWAEVNNILLTGNDFLQQNIDQRRKFANSKEVKDIQADAKKESIDGSLFFGDDFDDLTNQVVVNSLIDEATNEFFKYNKGSTVGMEDYLVDYLQGATVVDEETQTAYVRIPDFHDNETFSRAIRETGELKINQLYGSKQESPYKNIGSDDVAYRPYGNGSTKLILSYKDSMGVWKNVVDENGSPVVIRNDELKNEFAKL